ncbi:uncharacterized protein V6R79_000324 [Siganus canaliculatus]
MITKTLNNAETKFDIANEHEKLDEWNSECISLHIHDTGERTGYTLGNRQRTSFILDLEMDPANVLKGSDKLPEGGRGTTHCRIVQGKKKKAGGNSLFAEHCSLVTPKRSNSGPKGQTRQEVLSSKDKCVVNDKTMYYLWSVVMPFYWCYEDKS